MVALKELQKFLIDKAIIFPTAEVYGGFSGFFDYGPLGVELKRAIKHEWWKEFVSRRDIVGMDGCIITHPKVWEASGHVQAFQDPLVECRKCKNRFRVDHLLEDKIKINADGMSLKDLGKIMDEHGINCPRCGGELIDPRYFNLMFPTQVGSVGGEMAYLRPETAQLIFVDFPRIYKASRGKLPFGIAQVGRSFRNEISPRNFVFRGREFEQMEIEYFFNPLSKPELTGLDTPVNVLSREAQEKGGEHRETKAKELLDMTSEWHVYWLIQSWQFLESLGIRPENLRLRQHTKKELSHYAQDTWDIEFLYPFGWKELAGIADRSDYDLKQHAKFSNEDLSVLDGEKVYPHVIEPSFGIDRLVLALLSDAWRKDGERQLLGLSPRIAPIQVAVFPLVNKDGMQEKALETYKELSKNFKAFYDDKGSIGRRYRRQDSIGTPWCVTIDGQTLKDGTVTLRERDDMKQERVSLNELSVKFFKLMKGDEV